MRYCELKQSFKDSDYRKAVDSIIDYAESRVEIIGNDLSCINYPEVLYSLRKAKRAEKIDIFVYYNNASTQIIDWLKESEIGLHHNGKIFPNEYIVSDRRGMIISKKHVDYMTGTMTDYDSKKLPFDIDELMNYQEKTTPEKLKPRRIRVRREKPSSAVIENDKQLFDRITAKISKAVKPEKLSDFEETIRASRNRFL